MSSYVEANDQNSTDIFGLLEELENRVPASHTTSSHGDWPLVASGASALSLSEDQVDELFRLAATL
jgi:hypothetical protein